MVWNKCSEKLPEVGMLVIARKVIGINYYYCAEVVHKWEHKKECYLDLGADGYLWFNPEDVHLEWKEVEKD